MSIVNKHTCKNVGFTITELLITITILAIVMTIAIPSFQSLIQNNYSINLTNDMLNTLYYARSEAIRQGTNVSVCASSNQSFSACGSDWNQGWIVFIDSTGNGTYSSGSTLLRTHALTGQSANITTTPTKNFVTYNSTGFAAANTTNATFNISATGCTSTNARTIGISMTGYLTVNKVACP